MTFRINFKIIILPFVLISCTATDIKSMKNDISYEENTLLNIETTENQYSQAILTTEDKCSICLTVINRIEQKSTKCNHEFHSKCLNIWLENNTTCPICRSQLRKNSCIESIEIFMEEHRTISHLLIDSFRAISYLTLFGIGYYCGITRSYYMPNCN